jgi:glutamate 5-kinase
MGLAQIYETKLREQGLGSAQVLLTHADLADRERYLNARSTLLTLLALKVVPVVNENDTVVNDEIKFGDNDTLGALVANLVDADALVILTDQRGLYSADPRKDAQARFIDEAQAGDPELERMAGGAGSSLGRGGMLTKVLAAKRAASSGNSGWPTNCNCAVSSSSMAVLPPRCATKARACCRSASSKCKASSTAAT